MYPFVERFIVFVLNMQQHEINIATTSRLLSVQSTGRSCPCHQLQNNTEQTAYEILTAASASTEGVAAAPSGRRIRKHVCLHPGCGKAFHLKVTTEAHQQKEHRFRRKLGESVTEKVLLLNLVDRVNVGRLINRRVVLFLRFGDGSAKQPWCQIITTLH